MTASIDVLQKGFKSLKTLEIGGTAVSQDAVDKLAQARPDLKIVQ